MILINKPIIPPRQWAHNYEIKDIFNKTLKDYL